MKTINSFFKTYNLDFIFIPKLESSSPSFHHILKVSDEFSYSYLLLTRKEKVLFCSSLSKPDAIKNKLSFKEGNLKAVLDYMLSLVNSNKISNKKNNLKTITIGVDSDFISYTIILKLKHFFKDKNISLNIVSIPLENLRELKTKSNLKYIKKACTIVSKVADIIPSLVYEGISESELKSLIEYEMTKLGSTKPSFDTIVLFGKRTALPHGKPNSKIKLKKGDFILCDFGATVNNYVSDLTRTFIYKPNTKSKKYNLQKTIYNLVLNAQQDAIKKYVPNHSLSKLNKLIITKLNNSTDKLSLNFKMIHSLGHGFGIQVHELPFFRDTKDNIFKKNQTVTCEPGLYNQDIGGVRIEDDILITDTKPILLTTAKKTFKDIIID